MQANGIALWLGCGAAAYVIARILPFLRIRGWKGWVGEAVTALVAAGAAGVTADALDFGGWREADWRAGAFAFFVAFAATAIVRLLVRWRRAAPKPVEEKKAISGRRIGPRPQHAG